MDKSIYEIISENMENGELKNTFSFAKLYNRDGDGACADGSVDGRRMIYGRKEYVQPYLREKIIDAVKCCSEEKYEEADKRFSRLRRINRALGVFTKTQKYILSHTDKFKTGPFIRTAKYIVFHSVHADSIKFALAILEKIIYEDDELKDAIRLLGSCDEFTQFAIWAMWEWENRNDEVFRLARTVHGWGRIVAVEYLEPSSPEIKAWLLKDGINNSVTEGYSALTVWNKADVNEKLLGQITEEEFHRISRIITALWPEKYVKGVSKLENREQAFRNYLDHAKRFKLDIVDYSAIYNIYQIAGKPYPMKEIRDMSESFLLSDACGEILSDMAAPESSELAVESFEDNNPEDHKMTQEAIKKLKHYYETKELISGEKDISFTCYADRYIYMGGNISDGVLSLTSEVYGDDYDSERHYIFTKEATENLFSIVTLDEFIELGKEGHCSGLESFLSAHGIRFDTMTI